MQFSTAPNINGTITINRADLPELTESAIVEQVAKQIGVVLSTKSIKS